MFYIDRVGMTVSASPSELWGNNSVTLYFGAFEDNLNNMCEVFGVLWKQGSGEINVFLLFLKAPLWFPQITWSELSNTSYSALSTEAF